MNFNKILVSERSILRRHLPYWAGGPRQMGWKIRIDGWRLAMRNVTRSSALSILFVLSLGYRVGQLFLKFGK